jgi:hypothetical protein
MRVEPQMAFCVREAESPGVEIRVKRHEIGGESEASLNQIRIEVSADRLPDDERELDLLCGRLVEAAEQWASSCIVERHADVSEP